MFLKLYPLAKSLVKALKTIPCGAFNGTYPLSKVTECFRRGTVALIRSNWVVT